MMKELLLTLTAFLGLVSSVGFGQIETRKNPTDENANKPLFEVNVKHTDVRPGQFVLCPSRQFFDNAKNKGVDRATFIYYAAKLEKTENGIATVRNLAGSQFALPDQMIIPIPAGQKTKKGDILLTWWQSGSGMQRAIVVGGTATEPVVRYLDIKIDNPSGAGKKEDKLKPDSFYVLNRPFQIGTTVTAKGKFGDRHGQLVAMDDDHVLLREFGGKLKTYSRADCNPIPIIPELTSNEIALAALYGSMKPVTVDRIDTEIGRVFATFQLGRKDRQIGFAFGDIMKKPK